MKKMNILVRSLAACQMLMLHLTDELCELLFCYDDSTIKISIYIVILLLLLGGITASHSTYCETFLCSMVCLSLCLSSFTFMPCGYCLSC